MLPAIGITIFLVLSVKDPSEAIEVAPYVSDGLCGALVSTDVNTCVDKYLDRIATSAFETEIGQTLGPIVSLPGGIVAGYLGTPTSSIPWKRRWFFGATATINGGFAVRFPITAHPLELSGWEIDARKSSAWKEIHEAPLTLNLVPTLFSMEIDMGAGLTVGQLRNAFGESASVFPAFSGEICGFWVISHKSSSNPHIKRSSIKLGVSVFVAGGIIELSGVPTNTTGILTGLALRGAAEF